MTVDTEKFKMIMNAWYYQVRQVQKGYSDNNHQYSKGEASFNGSKSTAVMDPYLDYKGQQGYGFRLLPSIKFSKNYKVNFIKKEKKWLISYKRLIMLIKTETKQIIKYKR